MSIMNLQSLKWRTRLTILSSALILVVGTGQSCPGKSSDTSFQSQEVLDSLSGSSSTSKTWSDFAFLDEGLNVSNTNDSNISDDGDGTANRFPMAVLARSDETFAVGLNRDVGGGGTQVYGYLTAPTSFTSNTWSSGLSAFITAFFTDGTRLQDSVQHPLMKLDGNSTAYSVFAERNLTDGEYRMIASRKTSSGSWEPFVDIRDATTTGELYTESMSMAVDAYNDVIVVWCQDDGTTTQPMAYYNEYRPFSGWRFTGGTGAGNFNNTGTTDCSASDYGMDVGFDDSGNGYAAYPDNAVDQIDLVKWSSDSFASTVTATVAGAGADSAFPKLFVDSDGTVSLFFYSNMTAPNGELYFSVGDMAGTFSAATQFDSSVGAGTPYVQDSNDYFPPVLAYQGDNAVVGFIKSDGTAQRIWLSTYSGGGSWGTPVSIDDGGAGNDVSWADAAINSSGDIVVTWSAAVSGGNEGVYANFYDASSGAWQGATRLDTSSSLVQAAAPAEYRPSCAIDSDGNAMVTASMSDGSQRRAVSFVYK